MHTYTHIARSRPATSDHTLVTHGVPPSRVATKVQVSFYRVCSARHSCRPALGLSATRKSTSTAEHVVRRELDASSRHRRTEPSMQFGLDAANLPGARVLGRHAARRAHVDDLTCASCKRHRVPAKVRRWSGYRRVCAREERTDGDAGWEEREGQSHDVHLVRSEHRAVALHLAYRQAARGPGGGTPRHEK